MTDFRGRQPQNHSSVSGGLRLYKGGQKEEMYRKESEGWFKHTDFILIDMICLQIAFYLAYLIKGLGINPYNDLVYRNMAIVLELADLVTMFMLDMLHHVTAQCQGSCQEK